MMTIGLFLLATLNTDTSFVQSGLYMLITGIGVGFVMQVIVLSVQNTVDHAHMGTATAATNFFRSMGSAFGVAIAGAIINNRFDHYLPRYVDQQQLQGIDPKLLTAAPEQMRTLPEPIVNGLAETFAHSVDVAFLVLAPIGIIAFALTWLLREAPLRETTILDHARESEEAAHVPAEPLV
jgi:hypothetical protein